MLQAALPLARWHLWPLGTMRVPPRAAGAGGRSSNAVPGPSSRSTPQRCAFCPPQGDGQMDCHYACLLSLGNLAKNPTEHKNRKALFKETGSRARNKECVQVIPDHLS